MRHAQQQRPPGPPAPARAHVRGGGGGQDAAGGLGQTVRNVLLELCALSPLAHPHVVLFKVPGRLACFVSPFIFSVKL